MCIFRNVSFRTKFSQPEELCKISWKTPTLTHTALINIVWVYRVTSGNLFPRSDQSKLQATVVLHTIHFTKKTALPVLLCDKSRPRVNIGSDKNV